MNKKKCLCELLNVHCSYLENRLVIQLQDKVRKLVTWPYLFEQYEEYHNAFPNKNWYLLKHLFFKRKDINLGDRFFFKKRDNYTLGINVQEISKCKMNKNKPFMFKLPWNTMDS